MKLEALIVMNNEANWEIFIIHQRDHTEEINNEPQNKRVVVVVVIHISEWGGGGEFNNYSINIYIVYQTSQNQSLNNELSQTIWETSQVENKISKTRINTNDDVLYKRNNFFKKGLCDVKSCS